MAHKLISLCSLLLVLGAAACGVKPGELKAPEGANPSAYPKTYPTSK